MDQASQRPGAPALPHTLVCIATSPRTGSTWLSEAMESTGVLGHPTEYLDPSNFTHWATTWKIDEPSAGQFDAYFASMVERSQTPNGVAAIKMFALNALYFDAVQPDRMAWLGSGGGTGAWRFKMVHLRRRDVLRAAVSELRATATNQWTLRTGQRVAPAPTAPRLCEITRAHELHHAWDRFWCGARACDTDWIELFYEDLLEDLSAAIHRIGAHVGVATDVAAPSGLTRRQSDGTTEEWIERWTAAGGRCDTCHYG